MRRARAAAGVLLAAVLVEAIDLLTNLEARAHWVVIAARTKQLVAGAIVAGLVAVYAGNCVKNVRVLGRVKKVCPALAASGSERLENSREFYSRLFADDAPLMMQLPDAVSGRTCATLERELAWYRWNLFRKVRMEETRALRQEMTAAIDRAIPVCPQRVARSLEADPTKLDLELAATSCQVLKTLRVTLNVPAQDASPWLIADQLERLVPARVSPSEGSASPR